MSLRARPKSRPMPLPEWPSGTAVILTDDDGRRYRTVTRSAPWMLGGDPVVAVEGIAGGFLCERMMCGDGTGLPHFEDRKAVRAGTYTGPGAAAGGPS
jgi:hypothetical protein